MEKDDIISRRNHFWFVVAVFFCVAAVIDLFAITVEANVREMPPTARCWIVNTVLSLPFDTEYKEKERKVRIFTQCAR